MPNNTTLATLGIKHLRWMLGAEQFGPDVAHYISALCDYTEAQISARNASAASGGKGRAAKLTAERRKAIASAAAKKRWAKKSE